MQAAPGVNVGPDPMYTTCPQCRAQIRTEVNTQMSSTGYIAVGVLCLLGCCLCSWIPCCMDRFQNTVHRCPNCKTFIGQYSS